MKANELMIGDWVSYTEYEYYRKVSSIDPLMERVGLGYIDLNTFPSYDYCDIHDVNPIPLTPEILEKNGWKQSKYETCSGLYEYKGEHLSHLMVKRSNGRWVAIVDGQDNVEETYDASYLRINIFYVHELQHALRLCGLNDLADNFKV